MTQGPAGNTDAPATEPYRYNAELAGDIEARWQDRWEAEGTFEAPNPAGPLAEPEKVAGRPKMMVMDMFPYPSGAGLHVGHPLGFIATDVYARFKRMTGHNVLHTLGYDAFGLPAEQYAVQTGTHPRVTTEANIANMRRQLRRLGLGHDQRRSIATTDPAYYRWTQWIFLQIFNSWYDPQAPGADGGLGRARPIAELVEQFEKGERATPDARPWAELTGTERAAVLDEYRLAYVSQAPVNWAPGLGTVLANEEVTADGRSERGNFPVFKANLRQWMMRITAYSDRLLADLDKLDWPEPIKTMQRNWIGRSEGAKVSFATDADPIEVFTTRPDTLFGATYMVLAPEHALVDTIAAHAWPADVPAVWTGGAATPAEAIAAYRRFAGSKSDVERQSEGKDKTGVFTGAYATNPVTGERVPVFIADYVLMGYGTGAIMAVPAHDHRDFEFARAFELPIRCVVRPTDDRSVTDTTTWADAFVSHDAELVNSAGETLVLDGLGVVDAKKAITAWLAERGIGEGTINFKLRDWLFSRQRYWGEPFPIVFDQDGVAHALPDSMLPVELPEIDDYRPRTFDPNDADTKPETPLSRNADWVDVTLDLGDGPKKYRRETNTMPNWAGSCWYELRYLDPTNTEALVDPEVEKYWMGPRHEGHTGGADLYVGGVEHAVLHLLYSRFWHKVLFDLGHVSSFEPFHKLFNQGYIQAFAYTDERGVHVEASEVVERDGGYFHGDKAVNREYGKMGKSLKNSVTPDQMAQEYGADTLRLYEMSMGPLEISRPWDTRAVIGSYRFLQRLWRNIVDEHTGEIVVVDEPADVATLRATHKAIDGMRRDMDALRFNTAIAKAIELNNTLVKLPAVPREIAEKLVLMIAPLVPHVAEELWSRLGHGATITFEAFPEPDPTHLVDDTVTCVVQIKGKVKARLEVAPSIGEDELRELALADPTVVAALGGVGVRMTIVKPPKLVNIVPA